jgi:hypothetical protein
LYRLRRRPIWKVAMVLKKHKLILFSTVMDKDSFATKKEIQRSIMDDILNEIEAEKEKQYEKELAYS